MSGGRQGMNHVFWWANLWVNVRLKDLAQDWKVTLRRILGE